MVAGRIPAATPNKLRFNGLRQRIFMPDRVGPDIGHCCHWITDITAAGEDPIAVIQWRVQFVDREWPLSRKSNAR
ncbi:hypothetical protein AWB68_08420 [Caballeronia choica]|jgi:hypothetical protein|uniref:Uncharacterized protein n=1 Tax=Caballeronia choica TaxID=326476 RepID=A0A158L272_9BURK|nr:hypothetical protein AWB68_08420 [Caballeronia choica]